MDMAASGKMKNKNQKHAKKNTIQDGQPASPFGFPSQP